MVTISKHALSFLFKNLAQSVVLIQHTNLGVRSQKKRRFVASVELHMVDIAHGVLNMLAQIHVLFVESYMGIMI